MIKDGIIQLEKINGIPVIIDLIPVSNITSRPQHAMEAEYITIHNTGNAAAGADAQAHTEYVDNTASFVSWHFTVDDKEIYQELPITESAWHAGDGANGTGNRKSIAIEICEHEGIDYPKAEENAIQLIVYLLEALGVNVENVVPHQLWSGKYCPHIILDNGWDGFISRIDAVMDEVEEASPWAEDAREWVMTHGISDGSRPKDYATREEVWTMLYRAYHLEEDTTSKWN